MSDQISDIIKKRRLTHISKAKVYNDKHEKELHISISKEIADDEISELNLLEASNQVLFNILREKLFLLAELHGISRTTNSFMPDEPAVTSYDKHGEITSVPLKFLNRGDYNCVYGNFLKSKEKIVIGKVKDFYK